MEPTAARKPAIDYERAFKFLFADPQWVSKFFVFAVAVLFSIFLIGLPVVFGYVAELMRNVRRGDEYPLPDWSNFGAKLTDGLKLTVVYFVVYLPVFVLYCGFPVVALVAVGQMSSRNPNPAAAVVLWIAWIVLIFGGSFLAIALT